MHDEIVDLSEVKCTPCHSFRRYHDVCNSDVKQKTA
jgi:hypothetical protein